MRILLLTDIHAGKDTNRIHLKGENYINVFGSTLVDSIGDIIKISNNYDLIVNLGDFISESSKEDDIFQYQQGINLLNKTGLPLLHVAGNHDLVYMNRGALAKLWNKQNTYYYEDVGGYRHIILDGNREDRIDSIFDMNQPYRFDMEQIYWLEDTLDSTTLPVLIYCHFPIDEQDLSKNYYWENSPYPSKRCFPIEYRKIRKIIENSKKVIGVFSGHTHFHNVSTIEDIPYYTIGSFSENDTYGKSSREYGSVILKGKNIAVKFENL